MTMILEPGRTFVDSSNRLLANGTIRFCEPGTGVITLKATYPTNADLLARTNANSNPMTINSGGRLPYQAHGNGKYRIVVRNSLGNTVYDISDVNVSTSQRLNVIDYGAIGDGTTDDTTAIQAAIDALGTGGGTVYLPKGTYRTTATLTVTYIGVTLVGDGTGNIVTSVAGSTGVVATGSVVGAATRIYADFTSGPVIRFKNQDNSIQDMTIDSSTTRKAAALSTNYGIWIEATDTGSGFESTNRFFAHRVRVTNQPSHGWVMVNSIGSSRLDLCTANYCQGHGFVISGGAFTGRTNKTSPGQVDVWNCLANDTGGHSILVGSGEVSDSDICYRVNIHNFETFYNCENPSICVNYPTPSNGFISGENHTIANSAFDGRKRYPSIADAHSCLELRGRFINVVNNRFIDGNPYSVKLVGHTRMSNFTKSVNIENAYISNSYRGAGFYNPAVYYSTDVNGVVVTSENTFSIITTLSSRTASTFYTEIKDGTVREDHDFIHTGTNTFGLAVADVVRSNDSEFTMADDTAAYIDFGAVARGVLVLAASVQNGGVTMVAFRVGDANAYAAVMASSSASPTVTGGTGTLAGTTGTDTHLTLRGDTASNRLYIENRTGASRTYNYTILAANDLTAVAQIVAV